MEGLNIFRNLGASPSLGHLRTPCTFVTMSLHFWVAQWSRTHSSDPHIPYSLRLGVGWVGLPPDTRELGKATLSRHGFLTLGWAWSLLLARSHGSEPLNVSNVSRSHRKSRNRLIWQAATSEGFCLKAFPLWHLC